MRSEANRIMPVDCSFFSSRKVLIVINKDDGKLGPSEAFITEHIERLPCDRFVLIGNPGYRELFQSKEQFLPSKSIVLITCRRLWRGLGFSSVEIQDRHAVAKFLLKNKVSAVLAEYGPTAVSVMGACKDTSVPLVAHFHGFDAYVDYYLQRYASEYQHLFKFAAAVVAVSKHMQTQLLRLGANPKTTFYNSCGANIPSGLRANPGHSGLRFLMVGRLTEKKAPLVSIRAFSRVARLREDAILDVVGDGPLSQACSNLVRELNLSSRVVFHGALPHLQVLQIMSRSYCFVQHSVKAQNGDSEGTPVSIIEAMGLGLPVVVTRHGGIIDIVRDGVTGILVDEHDQEGMARAMLLFAEDVGLARTIGEKARAVVLADHTCENSVSRLWNIIEGAIRHGQPASGGGR